MKAGRNTLLMGICCVIAAAIVSEIRCTTGFVRDSRRVRVNFMIHHETGRGRDKSKHKLITITKIQFVLYILMFNQSVLLSCCLDYSWLFSPVCWLAACSHLTSAGRVQIDDASSSHPKKTQHGNKMRRKSFFPNLGGKRSYVCELDGANPLLCHPLL